MKSKKTGDLRRPLSVFYDRQQVTGGTRYSDWWVLAYADLDGKQERQRFILVQAARQRNTLVQLGVVPLCWGVVYD